MGRLIGIARAIALIALGTGIGFIVGRTIYLLTH